MARLIQMAVSMLSTRMMGKSSWRFIRSRIRNTAPMASRFTLTMSAVMVSIRS